LVFIKYFSTYGLGRSQDLEDVREDRHTGGLVSSLVELDPDPDPEP
jgi:hypothetical protein